MKRRKRTEVPGAPAGATLWLVRRFNANSYRRARSTLRTLAPRSANHHCIIPTPAPASRTHMPL